MTDDLTEWARREAAKLPAFTDEQAAEAGRLAAKIDARIATRELAETQYIADLLEGRYHSPEGLAKLTVLLHPEQ